MERMREHVSCLYNLSETLAATDLLVSMATYCALTPCGGIPSPPPPPSTVMQ